MSKWLRFDWAAAQGLIVPGSFFVDLLSDTLTPRRVGTERVARDIRILCGGEDGVITKDVEAVFDEAQDVIVRVETRPSTMDYVTLHLFGKHEVMHMRLSDTRAWVKGAES